MAIIADKHEHIIVNSHATFRWRHGLFSAFDFDQTKLLRADFYITLLDNVESVHQRLLRDHELDHSLKDIMVWREEELSGHRESHRECFERVWAFFYGQPRAESDVDQDDVQSFV